MEQQISASILSADLLHLEDEIRRVEQSGADMLHFDVMDGMYVPNISFGLPILRAVRAATSLFLDVHLMIQYPGLYIRNFAESGADMITFHVETGGFPFRTIEAIRSEGKQVGIALNPGTPAQAALPFLDAVDSILVMTVEPGFGGQSYMHDMNDKIRQVRDMIGERPVHLEVDGGISDTTVREAVFAGADRLVAGKPICSPRPIWGQPCSLFACRKEYGLEPETKQPPGAPSGILDGAGIDRVCGGLLLRPARCGSHGTCRPDSAADGFFCLFLRGRSYRLVDLSNIANALLLVLMFPATIPFSIVILSTVFAVAVGAHVFGCRKDLLFPRQQRATCLR